MAYQPKLAYIIATFLQAVAYGMNIISFVACLRALVMLGGKVRPKQDIRWWMVGAALAMFSIATADSIIEVHFIVSLFYEKDPRASLEFIGEFQWWSIASFCFYFIQTWLGDSVLIYRCYIVWSRRLTIVAVPIVSSFAALALGIAATIIGSLQGTRKQNLVPIIITFYAMAITTNFISSSLIVARIWGVKKGISKYPTPSTFQKEDPLSRAIMVTIEAGLVYTISLIALVVIYLVIHTAQGQRGADSPRDSASFNRILPPQNQLKITKDVVVSHDPSPSEGDIVEINTGDTGKREDVRISW
ncbi:hypothetical protein C0991_003609 [Blastosporella zonata]|nr:hypothetical protein C0991_003609 [Blastosporella zonata]